MDKKPREYIPYVADGKLIMVPVFEPEELAGLAGQGNG